MFNLTTQHLDLFEDFAKQWHKATGSKLLFISPQGEIIAGANGSIPALKPDLVKKISPRQTGFFTEAQQNILTVPLAQGNQLYGYFVALNAQEHNAPLLNWGVENIAARLEDTHALQNMTDELIGAWDQLELIYRVTQNLALTSNLTAALRSILFEIKKVVGTEDGFFLFEHNGSFSHVTCNYDEKSEQSSFNQELLNNLAQTRRVIVCNSPLTCRQVWPDAPDFLNNLLATPIEVTEENTQAAIGLINKTGQEFTAGDVKLMGVLAQQVATVIRNFLTHQKVVVEERLSRELEIAAEIQESLLPAKLPQLGGLSMAVSSVPASEVGGDFYDFVTIDDRHLIAIIGDVSGKGIPAAMLTSVTRTMLRVEAMRGEPPHKIIQQANNVLHQDLSRADAFVTVFVAVIDTFEGKLTYASAGHTPTLLWQAETGAIKQLKATGLPIGIISSQEAKSYKIDMHPGDTLICYTDGITEAHSPKNDLFGLNRLIYIVESRSGDSPESLQQYIQGEVADFSRHAANKDDATLLVIKVLPHSEAVIPQYISTVIKTLNFSYPADIESLGKISKLITTTCRELPALPATSRGDDFIYLIELAISEICTNIIKHAYAGKPGEIRGRVTLLNNGVQLDFYDTGHSFDPNTMPKSNPDPRTLTEGGYGLHIVRQIMDVVSYEIEPTGNHWHLIKILTSS